jgi:hypothetical protein
VQTNTHPNPRTPTSHTHNTHPQHTPSHASTLCDPYLNLFRGIIPPLGGTLDFSPILAFVVLSVSPRCAAPRARCRACLHCHAARAPPRRRAHAPAPAALRRLCTAARRGARRAQVFTNTAAALPCELGAPDDAPAGSRAAARPAPRALMDWLPVSKYQAAWAHRVAASKQQQQQRQQ